MISSNDLRPGVTIEYRSGVWQVIEAMHVKPGKGSAFVQTKLRNLETGEVLSVNFRAGERVSRANIERIKATFLYRSHEHFVFVNESGTESIEIKPSSFAGILDLLSEGLENILITRHDEIVLRVELPNTVELLVRDTTPDKRGNTSCKRGNTSCGGGKPATLETGAVVIVPFHIKTGDRIRVDTKTRQYVARSNE